MTLNVLLRIERMRYKPKAQFAIPGIIALIVLLGVKDLLPEWLRLYAVISVAVTLMMGILTGQMAQLSSDRGRRGTDASREGLSSVVLALLGITVALALTALLWLFADTQHTRASLFGTLLTAGFIGSPFELGALLVGFRTRHSKWGQTGLALGLLATALLAVAWTTQLLTILLAG